MRILFGQPAKHITNQNRSKHTKNDFGFSPGIEKQAEDYKHDIFGLDSAHTKISKEAGRQKQIKKNQVRKNHSTNSPILTAFT